MAKLNPQITAQENLVALINSNNPGLNLTIDKVTYGAPIASAGTEGRNTSIELTAVEGSGFSGSQTYSYIRQELAGGGAIATAKDIDITVDGDETSDELKTKIAQALGLIEAEIEVSAAPAPTPGDPQTCDVTPVAGSLLYLGSYTATIKVGDVPLDEASPNTDLDGFDPEA